jgi:hypothetical protein
MHAVDFRPIDPKARATSTLVAFADVYLQNLDTAGPQGPNSSKHDRNTGNGNWNSQVVQ